MEISSTFPKWFAIANTTTYNQAIDFCKGKVTDGRLCNRFEYCPKGNHSIPYEGFQPLGENWSPVYGIYDGWVNIGKSSPYPTCALFRDINGGKYGVASWSNDPRPLPWRNWLLCCNVALDPIPTKRPTRQPSRFILGQFEETKKPTRRLSKARPTKKPTKLPTKRPTRRPPSSQSRGGGRGN